MISKQTVSALGVISKLMLLMLTSYHLTEVSSYDGCDCQISGCSLSPISAHACPYFYKTDLSKPVYCVCLFSDSDYLSCDDAIESNMNNYNGCYYPSRCTPCISTQCTSQPGSCNWYSDCLNWMFSECKGDDNYALNYGLKYCNKYKENMYLFSDEGKEWITSVQFCLQEALIPQLSANPPPTCSEIKDVAFASHKPCYTKPGGDNSICQLSCTDLLAIMWTIKGAFLQEFKQTVYQSLGVAGTCVTSESSLGFKICLAGGATAAGAGIYYSGIFRIISLSTSWISRLKRSVDCDETCLAEGLAQSIFNKMNLPDDNTIEWFAFQETSGDNLEVQVLLSDLSFLNGSSNMSTTDDPSAVLDSAAKQFRSVALSQREVTVYGQVLEITQVSTCADLECTERTSTSVTGVPGAEMMLKSNMALLFCITVALLVVF